MIDKATLRRRLSHARRARSEQERDVARRAVADHVLTRADEWSVVAGYEPLRTEPGSTQLLAGLAARGCRVLVPITLADRDLDWAWWSAGGSREPLGRDAIGAADAVLVPALAVAPDGTRLGRGGGSYDRALRRCPATAPRVALLFDDEVLPELPRDEWDEPVTAVVRPLGWLDLDVAPGR